MGCFNKIGFYSHLPITYDNDIVYFICISKKYKNYDLSPFNVENNIDLINNFSSFCFCLMANCINFSPSSYGNQGILSECESMINMHREFIKILKMKKKEYE